jgi:hypothetical protein
MGKLCIFGYAQKDFLKFLGTVISLTGMHPGRMGNYSLYDCYL